MKSNSTRYCDQLASPASGSGTSFSGDPLPMRHTRPCFGCSTNWSGATLHSGSAGPDSASENNTLPVGAAVEMAPYEAARSHVEPVSAANHTTATIPSRTCRPTRSFPIPFAFIAGLPFSARNISAPHPGDPTLIRHNSERRGRRSPGQPPPASASVRLSRIRCKYASKRSISPDEKPL